MKNLFTPTTRKYIYGLVAAIVPILVSLQGLGPDIAAAIITIAAAVLAISNVAPVVDAEPIAIEVTETTTE